MLTTCGMNDVCIRSARCVAGVAHHSRPSLRSGQDIYTASASADSSRERERQRENTQLCQAVQVQAVQQAVLHCLALNFQTVLCLWNLLSFSISCLVSVEFVSRKSALKYIFTIYISRYTRRDFCYAKFATLSSCALKNETLTLLWTKSQFNCRLYIVFRSPRLISQFCLN